MRWKLGPALYLVLAAGALLTASIYGLMWYGERSVDLAVKGIGNVALAALFTASYFRWTSYNKNHQSNAGAGE